MNISVMEAAILWLMVVAVVTWQVDVRLRRIIVRSGISGALPEDYRLVKITWVLGSAKFESFEIECPNGHIHLGVVDRKVDHMVD